MGKPKKVNEFTSEQGNKYIFQQVPSMQWLDIMDSVEVNGAPKRARLYPAIIENVVVQPTLNVSDFDTDDKYGGYAELEEVVKEALRFQQGK